MTGKHAPNPRRTPAARAILTLLVTCMFTIFSGICTSLPAQAEGTAIRTDTMDAYMSDYLESSGLPGATVVVTQGSKVTAAGYGHDSAGRQLDDQTLMPIASVSKSFTSLAVQQLSDRGLVDLDHPVVEYVPGFVTADPRSDKITVRQLLNQTSGLSDQGFHEKTEPQPKDLAGAVSRLKTAQLVADPGTAYHYTNPNFHVAARLIEMVSHEPFADYLDRHIFEPVGMDRTVSVNTTADMTATIGQLGYLMIGSHPVAMDEPLQFLAGSSGVITTAADLGRWLVAINQGGRLPDGGRLVSPQGLAELRTPTKINPDYALGWELGHTASGRPQFGHGGIECTFTANQVLVPSDGPGTADLGIAVLANTGYGRNNSAAIAAALTALAEGGEAGDVSPTPAAAIVDWVMLALVAVVVALGVLQVIRSRRWAQNRAGLARWRTVLRLGLAVVPLLVCLSAPRIVQFLANGRDLNWVYTFFFSPTVVLFLVVGAITALAVALSRIRQLARHRSESSA